MIHWFLERGCWKVTQMIPDVPHSWKGITSSTTGPVIVIQNEEWFHQAEPIIQILSNKMWFPFFANISFKKETNAGTKLQQFNFLYLRIRWRTCVLFQTSSINNKQTGFIQSMSYKNGKRFQVFQFFWNVIF